MCDVMSSYLKFLAISAILVFILTISFPGVSVASEDDATLAITQAEETLASAYEAVLEAEQVGVNVSGLLGRLNLGGEYLAEAYVWYRLGVYDDASRFASLCYEVVGELGNEAVELRNEAKSLEEADYVVMCGSVVVIVVSCSVVWLVFKRRYRKRILGLRPEVVSGES